MLNSSQNPSSGVTPLETEQLLQGSLSGSQASLDSNDMYVDSREASPNDTEELSNSNDPTSNSTPSDPISTEINGTIQVGDDKKVVLVIKKNEKSVRH